ncbi:MAG: HPF/RaiA family ribosome-associated protein [Candidatus Gracilibacteria bacterium]|nr:HPF/RaiA family ribosome-associated protein [bacterium]MDZ4217157.1 HPF/RaiA family ribosome-associated protein [Candidatus Gracilibacteria bacterium]
MNLRFHFKNTTEALKEDLKLYAEKRFEHLERFLSSYQEDNKILTIDIEHHERHESYEVKSTLQIGGKVLHHTEMTHVPKEAIDKAEANLIRQAKKHIEHIREKGIPLEKVNKELPEEEAPPMSYDNI